MKKFFTLILLLSVFSTHAQRIYNTVFEQLPEDYQLYPRNEKNESYVSINGYVDVPGWRAFSVEIFREDVKIGYQKSEITYVDAKGKFKFNPITIKAELAEYSFRIFAISSKGDSGEVVHRKHVVSGDAYVIGGQSNAVALFNDGVQPYYNRFARTYGASYPYEETINWRVSEYGNYRVGQMGGGLQKRIIEKYKIPVCVINRAVGGINLGASLIRNPYNVGDLSNVYGQTYYMVKNAGLLNGGVKAFIWRQGENESSGGSLYWGELFNKLYNYWHEDFPDIHKYYIFQVGLIAWPEKHAGSLRDYQRRAKTIYNDVDNITVIGNRGYDGIHYDTSGHTQTVNELFRMIDRDLYGGKYNENVNSPNIQRAYFSKPDRKELVLEFEQDQQMVWVEDTVLIDKQGNAVKQYMKNMFYFNENSENTLVTSGKAVSNKIILSLNAPAPKDKFNYLPSFHDDQIFQQFGGPFLTNRIGMRAFSFDQVAIEEYTPPLLTPEITINSLAFNQLKISWKSVPKTQKYILEAKRADEDTFKEIAILEAGQTEFLHTQLSQNTTYEYRLKALGDKTESEYGLQVALTPAILATESDIQREVVIFPNPSVNKEAVIRFQKPMTGKISILTINGSLLYEEDIKNVYELSLPVRNYPQGTYLINIKNEQKTTVRKLMIEN